MCINTQIVKHMDYITYELYVSLYLIIMPLFSMWCSNPGVFSQLSAQHPPTQQRLLSMPDVRWMMDDAMYIWGQDAGQLQQIQGNDAGVIKSVYLLY